MLLHFHKDTGKACESVYSVYIFSYARQRIEPD